MRNFKKTVMFKQTEKKQNYYINENRQPGVFERLQEGEDDVKITSHFYLSGQRVASITQLVILEQELQRNKL